MAPVRGTEHANHDKRTIGEKQFTQDIIDTIGKRLTEIVVPLPKDARAVARIAAETKDVIGKPGEVAEAREGHCVRPAGTDGAKPEDLEVLAEI